MQLDQHRGRAQHTKRSVVPGIRIPELFAEAVAIKVLVVVRAVANAGRIEKCDEDAVEEPLAAVVFGGLDAQLNFALQDALCPSGGTTGLRGLELVEKGVRGFPGAKVIRDRAQSRVGRETQAAPIRADHRYFFAGNSGELIEERIPVDSSFVLKLLNALVKSFFELRVTGHRYPFWSRKRPQACCQDEANARLCRTTEWTKTEGLPVRRVGSELKDRGLVLHERNRD